MFVELHILQNFAPSNLNRDDTGAPKDCEFGGYRRARVSSQAFKRAIRTQFKEGKLVSSDNLAKRTKRLLDEMVKILETQGKAPEEARAVVETTLGGLGLSVADDGKTQYLLFLAGSEIAKLAELCLENWDQLSKLALASSSNKEGAPKRATKMAGKAAMPKEIATALERILDGGKASDLALFGRMLADLPGKNVDAASQVAHAISTNRISMEFDYYTAVDDLKPKDTPGADMIGTVGFNSACFYRYSNVDMDQLKFNLQEDEELARRTLDAFLRASIAAIPSGKQNSMAAHNPPSFILAVVRDSGLWNLANAFLRPVAPSTDRDLVQSSIHALESHWDGLSKVYGDRGINGTWAVSLDSNGVQTLKDHLVDSVEDLIGAVQSAVAFGDRPGR